MLNNFKPIAKIHEQDRDHVKGFLIYKDNRRKLCKQMMGEDMAIVSVKLSTDFFTRIVRMKRTTLADKIASIGEILLLTTFYNVKTRKYIFQAGCWACLQA